MLTVIDEAVVDENVPLSDTSTLRRVELLAKDVSRKLLENQNLDSLWMNQLTALAQLCICFRFYNGVLKP